MKLRPVAVTLASAAAFAGTFSGSGLAMASMTAAQGGPATARPAAGVHAAGAVAAALRARIGRPGGLPGATAGLSVLDGIVDGAGGRPVAGACVIATGSSGGAIAMTRPGGRYVFASLRPGKYVLHYSDCAAPGRYLDQWSGGASWAGGAALVTAAAGQVRTLARVTLRSVLPSASSPATVRTTSPADLTAAELAGAGLAPALARAMLRPAAPVTGAARGAISGLVTGKGKPLHGICAYAFGSRGFGIARTAKTGHYRIGHLRPGRYVVRFVGAPICDRNANWLPQWYRGFTSLLPPRKPTPVRVAAGRTTRGIDAALKLGGAITGTVRSKSGKTLSRVCVSAQPAGQLRPPFKFFGSFTESGRDGSYAMHALFPGKYLVQFTLGCGNRGNYAPQWWRDAPTQGHATPIQITRGLVVRHVDAALPPGATVSGVVRAGGPTGKLLSGICVFADSRTGPFASARTAKNGRYQLVGMTTSRYQIMFTRCRNSGNYLPLTRSVRVRTGQNITGFDAFLQPGAIVSGTVTDAHGTPVGGICVQVQGARYTFAGTTTRADGTYSIDALPTGSYTVQFTGGCGNAGSYAPQFYKGQTNSAAADPVPLIAGQTTAGIDAAMAPGGTITGVVTGNTGHKLSDVCVSLASQAEAEAGPFFGGYVTFTRKGVFQAQNLVPGLYTVNFGCGFGYRNFASQWFMAQPDAGRADLVSAAPGAITSGINATLQPGGTISGVVTNHAGKPLSEVCVLAIPAGSRYPAFLFGPVGGVTGRKGGYRISDLAPGSYDVQFRDCGRPGYGSQWYSGKATEQSATPVVVRPGLATTGVGAVMAVGGSISGQVTSSPSSPLGRICVIAQDTTTESSGFAVTGRTGSYQITGLSTGAYQVTFSDCGFPPRWGSVTRLGALHVTAPHAVTGINQRLSPAGTISGTVRGSASTRPLAQACVVVVPVSPNGSYGSAVTGDGGTYQVTGLTAGKYLVYFGDPFCPFNGFFPGPFGFLLASTNFAPQWYNDQPARSTATQVTVTAATNTIGVDASLEIDGGISGTVTDAGHAPVAGECVTAVPFNPTPDPLSGQTLDNSIAVTAADGSYALVDLPPGHYKVEFSTGCGDSGYQTQWWHHASSAEKATVITVSAAATVTGINATLAT